MSPSGRVGMRGGLLLVLVLAGCQASTPSPTTPLATPQPEPATHEVIPQISAVTESSIIADAAFAAVDIVVNPLTMEAELLPVRLASAAPTGQKFVVDLTGVMTGDLGCPDCLKITGLSKNLAGNVVVGLALRHPIAAPNLSAQIGTASLHVNNVRGFVVSRIAGPDGILGTGDDPDYFTPTGLNLPELSGGFDSDLFNIIYGPLANPDGYSRDVTPLVAPGFDTVYPYVVFGADDGTVGTGSFGTDGWNLAELENPTGYNVFAQGSTINGDLELALGGGPLGTQQVTFRFILTASYIVSRKNFGGQPGSVRDPLYFMPEGALLSPWRVTVDWLGTDGLGGLPREGTTDLATIEVRTRDWQKAVGDTTIVPALTESTIRNGLLGASRPAFVGVDIPGITSASLKTNISGDPAEGTEANPIVTQVNIVNNPAAPPGEYIGFVIVQDERTNTPIIGTGNTFELYDTGGANRDLLPYNLTSTAQRYATYQLFIYEVEDIGAHANIEQLLGRVGGNLVLDARGSTVDLPATSITTYRWVIPYGGDPAEFATPTYTSANPVFTTTHILSAGAVNVGLQVESDLGDLDHTDGVLTVEPARDPFGAPDTTVNARTTVTGLQFGSSVIDFNDLSQGNPAGSVSMVVLGNSIHAVFYGTPTGFPAAGLHALRSLDGGLSWSSNEIISTTNPNFTQFGGAAIAGVVNGGNYQVAVALGTISYATSGTGRIYTFVDANGHTPAFSWTTAEAENYTLIAASRTAAVNPGIAFNPNNPSQVHLLYGTDTQGTVNGVNRRWRIRSSTSGVAGLSSATPEVIDAASGPDNVWLIDPGSSYSSEIAVHPVTGDVYAMLGLNQRTYVLRSMDQGASWTKPLTSINHGATFYRDGDLVMDPVVPDRYYVARARRGAQFADPYIPVFVGNGPTLTPLATAEVNGPRSMAELAPPSFDTASAHVVLGVHPTGEVEAYWTEALGPPGGPITYTQNPHVQLDMRLPGSTTWSYDPDRTVNGTATGLNPAVAIAPDGRVHVMWANPALGTIYYRRG